MSFTEIIQDFKPSLEQSKTFQNSLSRLLRNKLNLQSVVRYWATCHGLYCLGKQNEGDQIGPKCNHYLELVSNTFSNIRHYNRQSLYSLSYSFLLFPFNNPSENRIDQLRGGVAFYPGFCCITRGTKRFLFLV